MTMTRAWLGQGILVNFEAWQSRIEKRIPTLDDICGELALFAYWDHTNAECIRRRCGAKMNPRDSMATTASMFWLR
jgi:hypothetical protein